AATSEAVDPADAAIPVTGRPGRGITNINATYAITNRPPVKMPARTKKTRTSVGSIARYSAIPPQTPEMTRLVVLRSRRADDMCALPSLALLVRDREPQTHEDGDRHGRVLGDSERSVDRHRGGREERDRRREDLGDERRRDRADPHERRGDEEGAGETGEARR